MQTQNPKNLPMCLRNTIGRLMHRSQRHACARVHADGVATPPRSGGQ